MDKLRQASKIISQGGIVIFPTDTAFGIGCRMDNQQAVEKLFRIRKRPPSQATPVLVANLEMAQKFLKPIPREVIDKLINPYWPGALTIVLSCLKEKVPDLVRGGTNTLGVRMPNHTEILEIIKNVRIPILAPSANFHGNNTPYDFKDLDQKLISLVDYVLPGEITLKKTSTIIDCTQSDWKILRHGAIDLKL